MRWCIYADFIGFVEMVSGGVCLWDGLGQTVRYPMVEAARSR